MNCKNALRLFSACQDLELSSARAQEVELHRRDCQACRNEWDGLQELVDSLKRMPPPETDTYFPAKVMARLPVNRPGKFRLLPAAAYALVFLMIFLSGFFLQLSSENTVGIGKPQAATFSAVLLENQDLGLLAVHDNTLILFER